MLARLFAFITVAAMAAMVGCGSSTKGPLNMGGEDGQKVALLVEDLNDSKGNPMKMSGLMATAVTAPDVKKYDPYEFYVLGKPTVNGAAATCKVSVQKVSGETAGEVEWGFEKVGDAWKIKSAPVP